MNSFASLQHEHDLALPDDEFYELDTVGDPAQDIRNGFAGAVEVPYVDFRHQREMSCPAAEAFIDALGSNDAWAPDLWAAINGDQLAAYRIKRAAVEYWIREQEEDLREFRRGTLFSEG